MFKSKKLSLFILITICLIFLLNTGGVFAQDVQLVGEEFNLELSDVEDEDGELLTPPDQFNVTVTSDIEDSEEVYEDTRVFINGGTKVPIELETAGEHELTIQVEDFYEKTMTVNVLEPESEMSGQEFNIELSDVEDADGETLTPPDQYNVIVESDKDEPAEVFDDSRTFINGGTKIPVELETVGLHTLTIQVEDFFEKTVPVEIEPGDPEEINIYPDEDQTVTVLGKIEFKAEAFAADEFLLSDDPEDFTWTNADENGIFQQTETGEYEVTAEFEDEVSDTVTVIVKHLTEHTDKIRTVAFSPEGDFIASGGYDTTVKIWDTKTGEVVTNFEEHDSYVRAVSFAPDGEKVVSGSVDNTVKIWDAETGEILINFKEHEESVYTVKFSPDGNLIASGGADGIVKIWDAETGDIISEFTDQSGSIRTISFSPDGDLIASGSWDGKVKVRDLESGETEIEFTEHEGSVESLSFSPEGNIVASGSSDETVKVWDLESGEVEFVFDDHSAWVWSVDFSPDGTKIVSSSDNEVVKVWNAETGEIVKEYDEHTARVRSVVFSPDGEWLASGSDDTEVKLWNLE